MTDNRHAIGVWLTRLARLVRHQQTLTDFTRGEMIADYTGMLLQDGIAPSAFSTSSLHDVAEQCDWWPPYASLRRMIEENWKLQQLRIEQHRNPVPQISGSVSGRPVELTQADEVWFRYWRNGDGMNWNDPDNVGDTEETRQNRRQIAISLLRRYAPTVFEMVMGRPIDQRDATDWHDAARLRRSLALTDGHPLALEFLECARAAVGKNAPENLPIVDEAIRATKDRRHAGKEMA